VIAVLATVALAASVADARSLNTAKIAGAHASVGAATTAPGSMSYDAGGAPFPTGHGGTTHPPDFPLARGSTGPVPGALADPPPALLRPTALTPGGNAGVLSFTASALLSPPHPTHSVEAKSSSRALSIAAIVRRPVSS